MSEVGVAAPYTALLFVAAFGLVARRLARGAQPVVAVWTLTIGSLLSASAGLAVLAMLSLPLVGSDDALTDYAHISVRVLARADGSGVAIAPAAFAVLVVLLGRVAVRLIKDRRTFAAAARLSAATVCTSDRLLVLPTSDVDAYTLAGRPGIIVATRGLLSRLSSAERRAVLAHERAHLDHHHHWHVRLVGLAATMNPLLWQVPAVAAYVVERWADEVSAAATSRTTAATALARIADAARVHRVRGSAALAAAAYAVDARLVELSTGPRRTRLLSVALPASLTALALAATAITTGRTWWVLTLAMHGATRVLPAR